MWVKRILLAGLAAFSMIVASPQTKADYTFPNNAGTTYLMNLTDLGEILGSTGAVGLPATYTDLTKDELSTVYQVGNVQANASGPNLIPTGTILTGMVGDLSVLAHFRPTTPGSLTGTFINDITPGSPLNFQAGDVLFFGEAGRNPLSTVTNPPSSSNPAQTGAGGYILLTDNTGSGFSTNNTGSGKHENPQGLTFGTGGFSVVGGTATNADNFTNATGSAVATNHVVLAGRLEDLTAVGNNGTFALPSGFSQSTSNIVTLMNTVAAMTGQDTLFVEEGSAPTSVGNLAQRATGASLADVVGGSSASSFGQTTFTNDNTTGSVTLGGPAKLSITIQSQFNIGVPSNYTQFQSSSNDPINYVGSGVPEPASCILFGIGLAAFAGTGAIRSRSRRPSK